MSWPGTLRMYVNGQAVDVPEGASVAAAVACVTSGFRRSAGGARRAPLCGMGICFECRVRIDGVDQLRACMSPAVEGMRVDTDG